MNMLEYYLKHNKDFIVKKHSTKDLYHVKYLHTGIDWSQPYALDARGIVLDGDSNVISRPYKKFFNYNELKHREDLSREVKRLSYWNSDDYVVMEKLDGTMAVVSQYEGEIIYSSSGNVEGKFPELFKSWFESNLNDEQMKKLKDLTTGFTLIFEYISPDHQIVVNYPKEDMVLHGIIHTESGEEITKPIVFNAMADAIGVDTAKVFNIGFDQVMSIQKQSFDQDLLEGFVVRFSNGKRLKIKTDEYMKLHPLYTVGFGNKLSKAKIDMYIDMVKDDSLDDLIAVAELKKDVELAKVLSLVVSLNKNVDKMINMGYDITKADDFDKGEYAKKNGSSSWLSRIVLNIDKDKSLDKIRKSYITETLNKEMEK